MTAAVMDRLADLEKDLPRLGAALEQRRLGTALRQASEATTRFDYQLERLGALARTVVLLKAYLASSASMIREIVEEADALGAYMETANTEQELGTLARDYPKLEREIGNFHRTVLDMLQRYVADNVTPLVALGRLLTKIGKADLGNRLQRLEVTAQGLRGSVLELPEGLQALFAERALLQSDLQKLAADPEVDAFLIALSKGQANLSLVTVKVLEWLRAQGAVEQFRVVSV